MGWEVGVATVGVGGGYRGHVLSSAPALRRPFWLVVTPPRPAGRMTEQHGTTLYTGTAVKKKGNFLLRRGRIAGRK